jgi:DNA adenine methylase
MEIQVDKETYDNFRRSSPTRQLERAMRFLYLNRTAFGGIYRLNRMGMFNVPYGGGERTPEPLWSENLLVNASRRLKRAHLHTTDFEEVLTGAKPGDFVYCDPTYTVAHNNNGFVRYNERNFSWDDQKRLADTCRRLYKEGVTVLVSNADHTDVIKLFRPPRLLRLDRMSLLSPDSEKRRATTELLFVFHHS